MNIDEMLGRGPMMFFDEESGGSSQGAAVFESSEPAATTSEPAASSEPAAAPSATVNARELAHEFGNVIGQHFQQQQPKREVTVEEAKRLLNVWEPSPEWVSKYDNLETRNAALGELRDGFIRQADTIAQYRLREMMEGMQQTYGPVVHYMQQQEARAGEWRFKQQFPELGHDNFRPLLFAVSQNILSQGIPFKSEKELFTAVAQGVEAVIRVNNPDFKLGNGSGSPGPAQQGKQEGQQKRPSNVGGIPVTTPGSAGGGGSVRGGQGPPRPRGLAIFD